MGLFGKFVITLTLFCSAVEISAKPESEQIGFCRRNLKSMALAIYTVSIFSVLLTLPKWEPALETKLHDRKVKKAAQAEAAAWAKVSSATAAFDLIARFHIRTLNPRPFSQIPKEIYQTGDASEWARIFSAEVDRFSKYIKDQKGTYRILVSPFSPSHDDLEILRSFDTLEELARNWMAQKSWSRISPHALDELNRSLSLLEALFTKFTSLLSKPSAAPLNTDIEIEKMRMAYRQILTPDPGTHLRGLGNPDRAQTFRAFQIYVNQLPVAN
jgi:hypothetical protein